MAGGLYIAGLAGNAVVGATSITPTPSADANFPISHLQGRAYAWEPFKFGSVGTDPELVFDTNVVTNSGFESNTDGQAPTGWTAQTGTPTVSSTQKNSGSVSLRLDGDLEAAYQDVELSAGMDYRLSVALYGDGANDVNLYLIDLGTQKYKPFASGWTTTKTAFATKSTTGFAVSAANVTLDLPAWGAVGPAKIRILAEKSGAGTAYVDDVFLWPQIDTCALANVNVPDGLEIEVHSSNDNFSVSDDTETTLTTRRGRMWGTFTAPATPMRYWKIVGDTPLSPYQFGQILLGQKTAFPRSPGANYGVTFTMPQVENTSQADFPQLQLGAQFGDLSANLQANLSGLWGASKFGEEPVLVVPDDSRPEFFYGRVPPTLAVERQGATRFDYPLELEDDEYGVTTR